MKKLLVILPILFFVTSLYAKEDIGDVFTMSFEELGQIEITGSTLTPEKLKTVPAAVTVFTQEDIMRLGLDSLDELMNLVPGFQSYRSSASSLENPYSSRGRRIADTGADILIMVDGQRLDEPRSNGSAIVVPKFPLMHIERVEFIRGSGSAIYGSNAMMGVINIITCSGVNKLSAGYGSFNHYQAYLLTSQQIGDVNFDLFGHIETDNGDDYPVQDTFGPNQINTDDPRTLANVNIKIRWQDTQILLQHNQFKSENFYELEGLSNGFNQRIGQLSSLALKQDFKWKTIESWIWLSYKRSRFNTTAQLTAPGDLAPISSPTSNDALLLDANFENYYEIRTQWHNNWNINEKIDIQFGFEFRQINAPETIGKNNFDLGNIANGELPINYYGTLVATTPVQGSSSRNITGFYTQYQHQLFTATHLTLGLRYDHFSSIGSQLSPRL